MERDSVAAANIVFATSTAQLPTTFGSDLAGADALCAARANAAALPGTFVAFLSTSMINAGDRLAGARGWVRPDGRPFADQVDDLVNGTIVFPPRLDEAGNDLGGAHVVSGTQGGGTASTSCSDYSDPAGMIRFGSTDGTYEAWFTRGFDPCNQPARIYCFGTSLARPVTITPEIGRRAFVTVGTFAPGGGVAAADALCASEAQAAGLSGTFQALLETSTAGAASRFSLSGATWVRLDGVPIVDSPAQLATGILNTSLSVTAAGAHLDGAVTFTGATTNDLASPQPAPDTCSDWTTSSGSTSLGNTFYGYEAAVSWSSGTCNAAYSLYCLEE